MDIVSFREYCIAKPGVTEDFPFDKETLVFKVGGKMFALCHVEQFASVNLKCDPELAIELREQYPGILPGYHMSKKHWNTVATDGSISRKLFFKLVDDSYALVIATLPKKDREKLGGFKREKP